MPKLRDTENITYIYCHSDGEDMQGILSNVAKH